MLEQFGATLAHFPPYELRRAAEPPRDQGTDTYRISSRLIVKKPPSIVCQEEPGRQWL